jgi:hypothetical protein
MVAPGAGHYYCNKAQAGIATFIFFGLAVSGVLFLPMANPFWGVAFRASLILYAYAFLDAFYTAREINAGMAQFIVGNNPRIAAMLNLLTNGFGYFYLGERKKGIACFFAMRIFAGAAQRTGGEVRMPMLVLVEIALALLAIDAYRLARKQLREAFPEANLDPLGAAPGLSAAVPAVLSAIVAFNYIALVAVGLLLPDYKNVDQSTAETKQSDNGNTFTNSKYGIEVQFPPEWEIGKKSTPGTFVSAQRFEGGCSVELMAEARLPTVTAESFSKTLRNEVEKNPVGFKWMSEKPARVGGLQGKEVSFVAKIKETDVRQNYVVAPAGLSMYALVETAATGLMDECSEDFQSIRKSIKIK